MNASCILRKTAWKQGLIIKPYGTSVLSSVDHHRILPTPPKRHFNSRHRKSARRYAVRFGFQGPHLRALAVHLRVQAQQAREHLQWSVLGVGARGEPGVVGRVRVVNRLGSER